MWKEDCVDWLKSMEAAEKPNIHKFRRSFQASSKSVRLEQDLKVIFSKMDQLEEDVDLVIWIDAQKFKLTFGQNKLVVHSGENKDMFFISLVRLWSHFNPNIKAPAKQEKEAPITLKSIYGMMKKLNPEKIGQLRQGINSSIF